MLLYLSFFLIFAAIFSLFTGVLFKSSQEFRPQLIAELIEKKQKKPFLFSLLDVLDPINGRLGSGRGREKVKGNLTASGSTLTVNEFFALKELGAVILSVMVVIVLKLLGRSLSPLLIAISVVTGILLPDIWLRWKTAKRHKVIIKSLPDIIDLLNLTVGAGLDFMSAMNMVVKKSRPGPLVKELFDLCQEVRMGKSRRDALRSMAKRINLPEVSSFVRTLVQADRMGTSIEEALCIHSEDARMCRFERGERLALKAPLKMLIPLIFCILPVVVIIVGGPIVLQFKMLGLGAFK